VSKPKARRIRCEVVKGEGGLSLYVNDVRVAGPKPWGGGVSLAYWSVDPKDIRDALKAGGTP
jgi:hypothetical protein